MTVAQQAPLSTDIQVATLGHGLSVDDQEVDIDKSIAKDDHLAAHDQPSATSAPAEHVGVSPRELQRYTLAYGLTTYGMGSAFRCAASYMTFQIQQIAYFGEGIGHNPGMPKGSGCLALDAPCLVPFGQKDINLTSVLLYLNAISFAVSGGLTLLICGLGDHLRWKREQYIFFLVFYGVICLPAAGLTAYNSSAFKALAALYTLFMITGSLVQAWSNIFIPYTMHAAAPIDHLSPAAKLAAMQGQEEHEIADVRAKREKEGLKMSVFGSWAMTLGMMLLLIVTIGVSYANDESGRNAGLYTTTVAGAVCVIAALGGWRYLPAPKGKPFADGVAVWKIPFLTFVNLLKGVYRYPEAFKWLVAYTVYNDSSLAFNTVLSTLFNNVVRPSLVEFTSYNIVGCVVTLTFSPLFVYIFPRTRITLRQWAIGAYLAIACMAIWMLIGLSGSSAVGFKHRAEFYVFQIVQNAASVILSSSFRVLFPEMFPRGSEIQYFGFQLVLSSSTTWIPQVVDGPIVQATNNIRLPAVIALVFFLVAAGMTWWVDEKKGIATIRREEAQALEQAE